MSGRFIGRRGITRFAAGVALLGSTLLSSAQINPTISDIPNQQTLRGTPTPAIPFIVFDLQTPPANLTLSAVSTNVTLVPTNNIVFGGSGSNRTVTVTPVGLLTGTTLITVTVRDNGGNTGSDSFLLTVTNDPVAITQSPTNRIALQGATVLFNVGSTGTPPLHYQWYSNSTPLADNGHISGATTDTLTLANVVTNDAGTYSVQVTNIGSGLFSSSATLSVLSLSTNVLLNIDFGEPIFTYSYKTGLAAIGITSDDYWNFMSPANGGSVANLKLAGGALTGVGLQAIGTLGGAGVVTDDPMYENYMWGMSGSWGTFILSNLPAADYDLYLYSFDTDFQLMVGPADYGTQTAHDPSPPGVPVWQEGRQYVAYRYVQVDAGQTPTVIMRPRPAGFASISGLQLVVSTPTLPLFLTQPTNQTVAVSSDVTFAATLTGTHPLSYRWYFNGSPLSDGGRVSGARTNVLNILNTQTNDTGSYQLFVTNSVGTTSCTALLTVLVPPVITQQPLSQTNLVGSSVSFSVSADGDGPFTWQWFLSGVPLTDSTHIGGATTASLTISNLVLTDAGSYTVSVSNLVGGALSSPAVLTIPIPPTITLQPLGRSAPVGVRTVFNATASGPGLVYQWQLNGTNLPGGVFNNYTNPAVSLDSVGAYQLVVTNTGGSVTSSVALLTIGPVAAWGQNQANQALPPAGLSNVVAVSAGLNYSLALRTDGTVIGWGNSSSMTNVPASVTNIVAISAGSSFAAALNTSGNVLVWTTGGTGLLFLFPPQGLSNVVAISSGLSHIAALRSDGTVVAWGLSSAIAATTVPPNLNKVMAIDAGFQTLALREDGSVAGWGNLIPPPGGPGTPVPVPAALSNAAAISSGVLHNLGLTKSGTVIAWGTSGPMTNVPPGISNIIIVEAAGGFDQSTGVSFAVRSNGTVAAWGTSNGGMTNVVPGVTNVVAISGGTSHALALENSGPPLIIRPPVGGSAFNGRSFTLRAKAVGDSPLGYQWQHAGTNLPAATNDSLTLSPVQFSDAGNYVLIVSNAAGTATSLATPVTVVDSAPFFLLQLSSTNRAFIGSKFSLATTLGGSGPLSLQWRLNGQDLPGANSDELAFARVRTTNMANYQLVASNSFGSITSALTTLYPISVASWGDNSVGATNVPLNLTNAVAIVAGSGVSMALRANGTLTAWGDSRPGLTNVPSSFTNVAEMAFGSSCALALKVDGTARFWGSGATFASSNTLYFQSNIVSISARLGNPLLLRPDGTVSQISGTTVTTVTGLSNAVALTPFDDGILALRADGTVFSMPGGVKPPDGSNVVGFASGRYQGLFLKRDGTLIQFSSGFLPEGLSNLIDVACGGFTSTKMALRSDGTVISASTTDQQQSSPVRNIPPGLASVRVLDAYAHALALLSAEDFPPVFLSDALDTPALVVSSKASPQWFGQKNVSHDGVDAARSAEIGNNTSSSMRMWVAGPTTVSFWWKVSSETNHDALTFRIGTSNAASISGEVDWEQRTIPVPPGNYLLQWIYSKDASGTAGQDAAWVDQVVVMPQAPTVLTQPLSQTVLGGSNVLFTTSVSGTPPLTYRWTKNSANVPGAAASSLSLFNVKRTNSGTYVLIVTNLVGTAFSSNAVLTVHVPQQLSTPTTLADGTLRFTAHDADGGLLSAADLVNFHAQASSNLTDWVTIPGPLTLTNGELQLIDPYATNGPARFYRLFEGW